MCAFIFFAAKERFLGRGCKIGVHSVSSDRGREDADSARVTLQVSRFLAGAGVPHSIIGKIVATPPGSITYLDNRDLAGLNVQRSNPFRKGYDVAGARKPEDAVTARPCCNLAAVLDSFGAERCAIDDPVHRADQRAAAHDVAQRHRNQVVDDPGHRDG